MFIPNNQKDNHVCPHCGETYAENIVLRKPTGVFQLTPDQLIQSANLTYVDPNLQKEFPFEAPRPIELVNFGKYVTNQEARDGLKEQGLEPASPWDVLAWIKDHPDWERKNFLAVVTGSDLYATFDRWGDERDVGVDRGDGDWSDKWVVLRASSQESFGHWDAWYS